jgi:hypothetical protein
MSKFRNNERRQIEISKARNKKKAAALKPPREISGFKVW